MEVLLEFTLAILDGIFSGMSSNKEKRDGIKTIRREPMPGNYNGPGGCFLAVMVIIIISGLLLFFS